MPGPVQTSQTRYISLDTDFGYDALGGVGRLGRHSMEVLEPGTRRTDRVPGPPRSAGRWFARVLDALTPAGWRAQGKFRRGLEDFSARTGRILGHLRQAGITDQDDLRRESLDAALRELSGLRRTARPMTSRGADHAELLRTRVARNMGILRDEDPLRWQEMRQLRDSGLLDEIISGLDPAAQADMAEDLALIRDALHTDDEHMAARVEQRAVEAETAPAAAPATAPATTEIAPQPYRSRFSPAALREHFLGAFSFRTQAQQALQERQATLARFTGEAYRHLQAALESVDAALHDRLSADSDSFARVRQQVDEHMREAIRCAVDQVCPLALRHLDSPESLGQDGRDFRRLTADDVRRELDALRDGQRPGAAPAAPAADDGPVDPFHQGIRQTRQQIEDISRLYSELDEGLDELARRDSLHRSAVLLHELAEADLPAHIDREDFGRACDTLIEGLRTSETNSWALRDAMIHLDRCLPDLPEDLRQRFEAGRAALEHHLAPAMARPVFQPVETTQAEARLDALEQARALHQVVGHAGALVQRARLPQADSLVAQGLHISHLAARLRTVDGPLDERHQQSITELRSFVARFMANLTLAHMQALNPTVHSAQPKAEALDADAARQGLDLLQRAVQQLLAGLRNEAGGLVARTAFNEGLSLREKGEAAALACGKLLANPRHKELDVAEQLAVCLESGREDAAAALQGLLEGSRWHKGKHLEARTAIQAFLAALAPVRASRGQSRLLRFLANRLSNGLIPHDVYRGFDGSIRMLINTDRQGLLDSKKLQGTRWITLPPPDQLRPGVSTGVHRLDQLLDTGDNRTQFYPRLHELLDRYLDGVPYDLRLPGDD